ILDKLENLFKYSPLISKKVIQRTKEILELSQNISANDLDIYSNFVNLKNVINKYTFNYNTHINKKIKLYEQNSYNNANNNLEQILKWYVNETRQKIDAFKNNRYYPELEKQVNNIFKVASRKNFPSVANFIKTNYQALKLLFPIWIMSPNEVSINLPNKENIFDYGIFDEASQMFIEHSIPSIYRCKNVCVAGDDKQLKPTNFFTTKLNYSDDDLEDEEYVVESLLDKAKECLWYEFNLKNHYRSKNANLIKFSNEYIYNNELETATINGNFDNWIEVYNVNGVWDDRRNSVEIDSILDYLEKQYTNQEYLDSVSYLLVTFNQSQKDELENRFANRLAANHEHFRYAYENNLLKFRNIENVQGDEADYVIFSCTYAKNKDNKFIQNFGPLMQDNGPNRLNVALTRAKEKMIVFKSFYGYEITNLSNNKNTEIFKKFILAMDSAKSNMESSNFNSDLLNEPLEFDSNFEKEVYEKLNSRINNCILYKSYAAD
ncbi:MAG: DNA2/NAM7 family helicase, partial [Ureaplasma sp.]|nr:DNA2/NAM7 family helicase [Ureaplasma sp.]